MGSTPTSATNCTIRAQANASVDKLHISVEEYLLFTGGAGSIPDGVSIIFDQVPERLKGVVCKTIDSGVQIPPWSQIMVDWLGKPYRVRPESCRSTVRSNRTPSTNEDCGLEKWPISGVS